MSFFSLLNALIGVNYKINEKTKNLFYFTLKGKNAEEFEVKKYV